MTDFSSPLMPWLTLAAAIGLGAASPGPSFVLVARTAVASGRTRALGTALGMGLGGAIFATLSLLGLQAVLAAVPLLYDALRWAGALYLLWLGIGIWHQAAQPLIPAGATAAVQPPSWARHVAAGLGTQLSNPKTAVVYASVFATCLPSQVSPWTGAGVVLTVLAIETGWYALVALGLSAAAAQQRYLRAKRWIDRAAAGAMIGLGVKVALSAQRS